MLLDGRDSSGQVRVKWEPTQPAKPCVSAGCKLYLQRSHVTQNASLRALRLILADVRPARDDDSHGSLRPLPDISSRLPLPYMVHAALVLGAGCEYVLRRLKRSPGSSTLSTKASSLNSLIGSSACDGIAEDASEANSRRVSPSSQSRLLR